MCEFPYSNLVFRGEAKCGLTYVQLWPVLYISGQGLGQVSLKGLTTGQMCKGISDFVGLHVSSCTIWVQGVGGP